VLIDNSSDTLVTLGQHQINSINK